LGKIEDFKIICFEISFDQGSLNVFILTRSVKFLSNAISIGIFLSRDIVALGNMRASKLHCSAILPKNIARVNQPYVYTYDVIVPPWLSNGWL
jgi:hypothetical protein